MCAFHISVEVQGTAHVCKPTFGKHATSMRRQGFGPQEAAGNGYGSQNTYESAL